MHSFNHPVPFFIAHLYTCRPRSGLKFPNVSHALIVSYLRLSTINPHNYPQKA